MAEIEREFLDRDRGFTHVVTTTVAGVKTIYVAGQVGMAPGATAPSPELGEQAAQAFQNLSTRLAKAGASKEDVVKLNVYIKDIDPDRVRAVGRAQVEHFKTEAFPAATWIGTPGLVMPELQVEIEAVAVISA